MHWIFVNDAKLMTKILPPKISHIEYLFFVTWIVGLPLCYVACCDLVVMVGYVSCTCVCVCVCVCVSVCVSLSLLFRLVWSHLWSMLTKLTWLTILKCWSWWVFSSGGFTESDRWAFFPVGRWRWSWESCWTIMALMGRRHLLWSDLLSVHWRWVSQGTAPKMMAVLLSLNKDDKELRIVTQVPVDISQAEIGRSELGTWRCLCIWFSTGSTGNALWSSRPGFLQKLCSSRAKELYSLWLYPAVLVSYSAT